MLLFLERNPGNVLCPVFSNLKFYVPQFCRQKGIPMYLNESMETYLKRCELRIKKLKELLAGLPEGEIQSFSNGRYRTWRVITPDGKRNYLSKKNTELARQLVLRKIYIDELHDLKTEAEACRRYLNYKRRYKDRADLRLKRMSSDLRDLAGESFKTRDERIAAWENETYEKYNKFQENLIHQTLQSKVKVRSKLEAAVANSLYTLKIPFKYEKMTSVGSVKIAVDFTALDVRTFQEILIEVFGMMDDSDYRQVHNRKLHTYIDNGYIPGVNLLTFYESAAAPLNPACIRQTLEDFFFNNPPIRL